MGYNLTVTLGPHGDLDAVWRAAVETNVQVRHLTLRKATLDQAFLQLLA